MFESLINVEKRYNELSELMADQQIASDYEQMARLAKERSDLQEMVETFHRYQTVQRELDDSTLSSISAVSKSPTATTMALLGA